MIHYEKVDFNIPDSVFAFALLGEEIKKYAKYLWKCKKKNKFTETHKIYML